MASNAWRLTASLAFASCALAASQASAAITATVLSSMPQLVTGGDALVKITGATAAPTVTVGAADLSAAFKADANGNYIGLVTGLRDGDNALAVKAGADTAALTLTNYAINGTLFAGPQQSPYVCENETFELAPAKDASCAAPTVVKYFYRDKTNNWKPFDPAGARPGDIGTTKTTDGKDVPVIVRQERGVINRAAYIINVLHDPAAGPAPTPLSRGGSAWNGKLVYGFGPGVGKGYHMGRSVGIGNVAGSFMDNLLVNGGYATASSSLNVFGNQPSDVLSAETMAKVKERFIEQYGPPLFTIGQGGSGGSMQQQLISNAYPGLLDGIQPNSLFADEMTFLQPLYDCELLVNVFKQGTWTRDQLNAVAGKYWGYCVSNGTRYPSARIDGCDTAVQALIDKDPALKAKPPRCTFQDNLTSVFGVDAKGFARNPYDNVGIQYGLNALNAGVISWAQFLDINTRIGGHDADGKIGPNRQVGDEIALKAAYMTGRVNEMTGGNVGVPYVDIRQYNDFDLQNRGDPNVNVHDGYHSLIVQARLQKYNGTTANYLWLRAAQTLDAAATTTPNSVATADALAIIDKWLTAIMNDKSAKSKAEKVAANRPAEAVDTCYAAPQNALFGAIEKITDKTRCNAIFPYMTDARIAAGGPMTADVFKCTTKPIAASDYKVAPTADQMAQLQKIFPTGTCDYSKPGVGQTQKLTTWASFKGDGTFVGL